MEIDEKSRDNQNYYNWSWEEYECSQQSIQTFH